LPFSVDNPIGKSIVATVLKKFIPQKPGSGPINEETESGETTPQLPKAPESKNLTSKSSVMADQSAKNSLANDVEIKGSIKFANEFIFDGKLEGEITSNDGILTVGESGDVHGEVKAKSVIVMGKVHGNITVNERCELRSRSQLIGDLRAARLIIEEGATFVGKSEVSPNKGMLKELGAKEKPQEVGAPR
jgi:cytoskeletal protein CcmA (bactofilin family)